jgi:A/G-specific adenine glycosylase
VIARAGKVLICRRPAHGSFAGYWEFPGGKREPNETVVECLVREVREELAMGVKPVHALHPIDQDYPGRSIRLHAYLCEHLDGEPQRLACQATQWVHPHQLRLYQFPPANEQLIEEAIAYLVEGAPAVDTAPPAPIDGR